MQSKSETRHIERVRKYVGKAINRYNLIGKDDKVLVAVSGGKDSLLMLETLALRLKYLPVSYELTAVHIDVENVPYQADIEYIREFCKKLEVPFELTTVNIDDKSGKGEKSPCFLCSWTRRKALFELASEKGYNKVALGHHLDDVIETLLMNMIWHGEISSMPAKLKMFNGKIEVIRPLILVTGNDAARYARIRDFREPEIKCPFEERNKREQVRNIITQISKMNRQAKLNLFRSLNNINHEYLPQEVQE